MNTRNRLLVWTALPALCVVDQACGQVLVVYEPEWRLLAAVPVVAASGAHFSQFDQCIYVASRLSPAAGGAIRRIDPSFVVTTIASSDKPLATLPHPTDGSIFFSEDYAGFIGRVDVGGQVSTWVSGFHSGDDDPMGMAIAPANYSGTVVSPGHALVADQGFQGPNEIWRWHPDSPEGETVVVPNATNLTAPCDIAITGDAVYFVDAVTAPGRVYELLPSGQTRLIPYFGLPSVAGVAVDPRNGDLMLRSDDGVTRFDPRSLTSRRVLDLASTGDSGAPAGIDLSPDGRLMILSYTGRDMVYVFERGPRYVTYGTGCVGSLGVSHLTALSPPRLGGTLRVEVDHLPLDAAFFFSGVSRTGSPIGPLPVPLASFGMPGCHLLASPDAAAFVIGSGNRAVHEIAVPWAPSLAGIHLFQQALVLDPAVGNLAGAVTSDAAEATVAVAVLPAGVTPLLDMVQVPAGSFVMGSTAGRSDELPVHPVHISRPFWMSRHEVTQAEYQVHSLGNPSRFLGPDRPVEQVTWHEAMTYCAALNLLANARGQLPSGYVYRLPTEAEWEYCCRAGTTSEYHVGVAVGCSSANVDLVCVGQTRDVGQYAANAWGLRDMHGNVWEWCLDGWDGQPNYTAAAATDPLGTGAYRVLRGGSWDNPVFDARSAARNNILPSVRDYGLGFRVVLAPILP
jgi:formylglycine-generating enzyme required for sulfatase activity